jgi:DNA polymerase family B
LDHHIPTHIAYLFETNAKVQNSEDCIDFFLSDIINSKIKILRCYAHNFSRFDSYFIVPVLKKNNINITQMYIKNGNIFFIKCKIGNTTIYFLDSAMYLNMPLKDIFKMYN